MSTLPLTRPSGSQFELSRRNTPLDYEHNEAAHVASPSIFFEVLTEKVYQWQLALVLQN
jgi:hypothetical protein